jgi:hypothetical protein
MCSTRALAVGGHQPVDQVVSFAPPGPGCGPRGERRPSGPLPFLQPLSRFGDSQNAVGGRWYSVAKPAGVFHMEGFANEEAYRGMRSANKSDGRAGTQRDRVDRGCPLATLSARPPCSLAHTARSRSTVGALSCSSAELF